ncbi:MAG: hypothetical protein ACFFFT_05020 [Candidatus Thorarchaeota archaeon]
MSSVFEIDSLPTILALRFNNELRGSNTPLIITGRDKVSGKEQECVVKLKSAERFKGRIEASSFELLSTFIAW